MACFDRKQTTGIGIVKLKRCRPPPGCLPVQHPNPILGLQGGPVAPVRVETWSPWPCSKTCDAGDFKTEFDPSSKSSFSYSLTDPAEVQHRYRDEVNSAAAVDAYGYDSTSKTTTDDDGCSVFNQSLACRNSSSNHVRLRRALPLGEVIYSDWTPWTTCSCTATSMNTRYRFCIVGKRQCIRAKGLFPTEETGPCQCGDTRGSQRRMTNHLQSRTYQPERTDPYTHWSNWDTCPCGSNAFRSRSRMCRPGHEMACFDRKQTTGIGIVKLKRCRPPPGCLPVQHPNPILGLQGGPVAPVRVETWSPWPCSKTCDAGGNTMQWRGCIDESGGGGIRVGCLNEQMYSSECNTNPCPVGR
eukprot:XP_011671387.1 PREDICTED: uncharacterized protein LOC105441704 [Strongylocentrotus purpuratus]